MRSHFFCLCVCHLKIVFCIYICICNFVFLEGGGRGQKKNFDILEGGEQKCEVNKRVNQGLGINCRLFKFAQIWQI